MRNIAAGGTGIAFDSIYGELLPDGTKMIKRKEDSQWVRRTDHGASLLKHRCNLSCGRIFPPTPIGRPRNGKRGQLSTKRQKSRYCTRIGIFSRKGTMQQVGKGCLFIVCLAIWAKIYILNTRRWVDLDSRTLSSQLIFKLGCFGRRSIACTA